MQKNVGVLNRNSFLKKTLNKLGVGYKEYTSTEEMFASDISIVFCDDETDLIQAVKAGKFVFTNHSVLMNFMGQKAPKTRGFYYLMKDFVFGERSFFASEDIYVCSDHIEHTSPLIHQFMLEQDFSEIGALYDAHDEKIAGGSILIGRQVISLPWNLAEVSEKMELVKRPYYSRLLGRHYVGLGRTIDYPSFLHLLSSLLKYAFKRQDLPIDKTVITKAHMGEQEIDFVFPSEAMMEKINRRQKKPYFRYTLLFVAGICFLILLTQISKLFAVGLLFLMAAGIVFILMDEKKRRLPLSTLPFIIGCAMIVLNLLYNVRSLPAIYPMYQSLTQSRYMPEFLKEQAYCDSFLQLFLKDKEVYVHYTGTDYVHPVYEYYEEGNPEVQYAVGYDMNYYMGRDYCRFFEQFSKGLFIDDSIMPKEEVDVALLQSKMTCLGYTNDLLRYVFLINQEDVEQASYFWYDFVYRNEVPLMYVYLQNDIAADCDKIIALWDLNNNLYLMDESYYNREVAVNAD
ncbi:MAG: hypothetical protein GX567_07690 [Clostridia bacterium]|nr:hypothetical protein [Clostridia bacterium]